MRGKKVRGWMAVGAVFAMSICARAQTGAGGKSDAAVPTRFEVVSIRPVSPDAMGGIMPLGGTEFREEALPLSILVQLAFGVDPHEMVVPEWAEGVKFDIAAKTGSSVPLTFEQMRPLLQTMLVERFGMTYHHETREIQGYAMVPAKGGLKLTPAKPGSAKMGGGRPGAIDLPNVTMKSFAGMLVAFLKRPVEDKTGAAGDYEVKLRFAPANDPESTLPSIFTVVQEDLGIKLESAKVPVETVVIDHLERAPTEN